MENKEKIQQLEKELELVREDLEDLRSYSQQRIFFTPVAMCTVSGAGKIIDVNQSFEDLTKRNSLELMGSHFRNFFQEQKKIDNLINAVKRKKTVKAAEITLISKDKKKIPVRVFCGPRKDKNRDLIGYFFNIIDITESKKFQEKLKKTVQKRTKELQKKIEELEKFHNLAVGRELKMIELKKEIERLKRELENKQAKNKTIY